MFIILTILDILDILDLIDYGPENNRNCRYVLVVIDDFSELSWTVPLKKKNGTEKEDQVSLEVSVVKNFILTFFKKITLNIILEIVLWELFLQNALIVP